MTSENAAAELSQRFAAIYTGALADVLYRLGYGAQGLPPQVQALQRGTRLAGPAFPAERRPFVPVEPADKGEVWNVFRAVPPHAVAVYAAHSESRSMVGDLVVAFLKVRGCAGMLVDGGVRDVEALEAIGLPIFCRHTTPQDVSHGSGAVFVPVAEITIGEVRIARGDYIVGDADGVVVIPQSVIAEVLESAERLVGSESEIRAAILAGEEPESAFERFG
jgi:4-hydroxy-4-methyl-2-oxoglutarate aldolase